jgi:hypothetical protein
MKYIFAILASFLLVLNVQAQDPSQELAPDIFPEKKILKKLKASAIEIDDRNEDGVFKARSIKTKNWGMYQWIGGNDVKELIPMSYDKIDFFEFNADFTKVYSNGKVGVYIAEWTFGESAKQTIQCIYDRIRVFEFNGIDYVAASLNGRWGWVDWSTGIKRTEIVFILDELPKPDYKQDKSLF